MIKLSVLTESDLLALRGKKVVIEGFSKNAFDLYDVFQNHQIEVIGFLTDAIKVRFQKHKNVPVISWKQLKSVQKKHPDLIVQCIGYDLGTHMGTQKRLEGLGVPYSNFVDSQLRSSMQFIDICTSLQNPIQLGQQQQYWRECCNETTNSLVSRFQRKPIQNPVILCLPPKTADHTLIHTFDKVNREYANQRQKPNLYSILHAGNIALFKNKTHAAFRAVEWAIEPLDRGNNAINYINVFHKARYIAPLRDRNNSLKIITAVREPISQTLSRFYQDLSRGAKNDVLNWILGDLEEKEPVEQERILKEYECLFKTHGDDVQCLWDCYVDRYRCVNEGNPPTYEPKTIQTFLTEFKTHVIDLMAYPFDCEAGYTIIKEGNLEIFVYQLEKLNQIVSHLSIWVDAPFETLEIANQASDKWVGESYQQAQKEIKITQEYFDWCFDESYVRHFYSESDIEKFKKRWRPHIK